MNINIIQKMLVAISIGGIAFSVGYESAVFPAVSSLIVQAHERSGETETQQSVKDEINRRRGEMRNLQERSGETETQQPIRARGEMNWKREERRSLIETKRNEFKNRTRNIVGEEKQQRVLKVADSINKINERQTNVYLNLIGRIDSSLQRTIERIEKAEQRGINMSEARVKAEEAGRIITEARGIIMSQASKIYTIEGVSREEISAEARRIRDGLRNDLRNIRTKVKEARAAVVEVIRAINNANSQ